MNARINNSRWLRWLIVIVVATLCARYIAKTFAWADIQSILRSANIPLFVGVSTLTLIAYWMLRAWRWQTLLRVVGANEQRWTTLYLSTVCSLALAIVTPFQSGEALKVGMLGERGDLGKFDGFSCFAIERVLDLLSILFLGAIGLAFNALKTTNISGPVLLLATATIAIGVGIVAWWAINHSPWTQRFRTLLGSLIAAPQKLAFCWALSLAGWLVLAYGWHGCLASININLSALEVLSLTATITLVNILSFIPGAVGVSEAGIAVVLGHLGHPAALAQSGAMMIRAYGLMALILGVLHYLAWRWTKNPGVGTELEA